MGRVCFGIEILLCFAACALCQNENAASLPQEGDGSKASLFYAGLHVSGGYNGYWDDAFADDFSGPVFNAGAALLFPLPFVNALFFQPEALLAYRRAWHETTEPFVHRTYTVTETFSQWNLEVPLLFRYHFTKGLFAVLGSTISLNISDEYKDDNDENVYTTKDTGRSTVEVASTLGVGYRIFSRLEFDVRGSLGINRVYHSEDPEMSPRTFQVQLGTSYWMM